MGREADDPDDGAILLGLLETVAADGTRTQRRMASDLGIALGLVNAYLKRCVKKGLIKVREAPARRYAYYLTPKGAAEKSRLTVDYLSHSFSFFREARSSCAETLAQCRGLGFESVALLGASDLAEIAIICARESPIEVVGIIEAGAAPGQQLLGVPVIRDLSGFPRNPDAFVVTDLKRGHDTYAEALAAYEAKRVFAPSVLRIGAGTRKVVK
jgi:DNA-binding MarR family transcriptional regulator